MIGDVEDVNSRMRRQARKNAAGQRAMEQLVLEAHRARQSLRQIAADAGMTAEGVRKMLARLAREADTATAAPEDQSDSDNMG